MTTWLDRIIFGAAKLIKSHGTTVPTRAALNFASPLVATDNAGADRTDVSVTGLAVGPGPSTEADEVPTFSGSDGVTLTRGPLRHVDDGSGNALIIPRQENKTIAITSENLNVSTEGSLTLGVAGAADTYIKLSTDTATINSYISHYTHMDAGSPPWGPNQLVALSTNRNIYGGGTFDDAGPSGARIIECRFFDGATTKVEIYDEATETNVGPYRRHGFSWDVDLHSGSWFVHASSSTWLANDATTQIAAMSGPHFSIGPTTSTSDALLITQVAKTSGVPNALHIVSAAHTGITASTACADVLVDGSATKTWAAGALATLQADFLVNARTYGAAGASVFTKAATFAVDGGPIAGANMTITTSLGIYCGGKAEFADLIDMATPNGIRVRNGTSYGATFHGVSSNVMGVGVYGGTTDFNIGTGFLFRSINGFVGNLKMFGGYNATQSYPILEEVYTFAATNAIESWSGGHKVTTSAWNTGGTPAANDIIWFEQHTSVQGNPPTAAWEKWAKVGSGANTKIMSMPAAPITVTGSRGGNAALQSLLAWVASVFPGTINDTTS